jgi:hypothetical protein
LAAALGLFVGAARPGAAAAADDTATTAKPGEVFTAEPPPGRAGAPATSSAPAPSSSAPTLPGASAGTVVAKGGLVTQGAAHPADPLAGLRFVATESGAVRVSLDGKERTLRPGDAIGGDTVRRVDGRRLVLSRPEGEGRERTVLVRFGDDGRAKVAVVSTTADEVALTR